MDVVTNNIKPNSHRYKAEQKAKADERDKKVEKVVTGKVITKKKSGLRKFADEFISEDAKNVKTYVLGEVLIPAIKKAIFDVVTDSIDMILYGESRRGSRRSTADKVSYRSYSDYSRPRETRPASTSRYSYDDIILSTRGEAEDVLSRMDELMEAYGLVRVADLYDLVGITGEYTDNRYGWTSIRTAEIVRVREGYAIKMPRAIPID
jgi:hypothetical protein